MKLKICFVLAVACVIQQISAFNFGCLHKDQGTDVCSSCKKGIIAPRPYPIGFPSLPKPIVKTVCKDTLAFPELPKPFQPIGDNCHCGKQHVKPAPTSRPVHNCHKPKPTCSCNQHKESEESHDCGHHHIPAPKHFNHFEDKDFTVHHEHSHSHKRKQPIQPRSQHPADVVSISISKQLSRSAKNGVSERNLQYGSLKKPVEPASKDVQKKNPINEELFYANKGQILELKPQIFSEQVISSEEDVSESDRPRKQKPFQPANLNFESIGYKTYQPENPRYITVKNSKPIRHETTKRPRKHHHFHHHHQHDESCGCYKDLVVDQSAVSEQSMSYESPNENGTFNVKFNT